MSEQGKIIGFQGSRMLVEMPRLRACARCGICMHGEDQATMTLELETPGDARIGDQVILELRPKLILQAAAFAYGLPIVGIVLGALLGSYLSPSPSSGEVFTLIGAGAGLVIGLLLSIYLDRTWGRKGRFEPHIVRIMRDKDASAGSS
ncbi:MAG: SoxR reducing system RseC family protein [candidate division NC10 bacterium]|nr:SoxR reducing system RseC family protein [candidate division NC10 bacterium]